MLAILFSAAMPVAKDERHIGDHRKTTADQSEEAHGEKATVQATEIGIGTMEVKTSKIDPDENRKARFIVELFQQIFKENASASMTSTVVVILIQ